MLINCCNCGEAFTDKDIKVVESALVDDVREVYYIIPCCNIKNVVAYKNSTTDKLEKNINTYRKKGCNTKVVATVNKLRQEMDKLRQEYGGNGTK